LLILFTGILSSSHSKDIVLKVNLDHEEDKLGTDEFSGRSVSVLIHNHFYIIDGQWHWELNTNKVFASNVILSTPIEFEGTKSIIFPGDIVELQNKLNNETGFVEHLCFRIITTYGEVKVLEGNNLTIENNSHGIEELKLKTAEQSLSTLHLIKEQEGLQLLRELYTKTERYTGTAIWYFNQSTNETWYSDQVFRIFELPPQSLNAHLNTFNHFIHADDKEIVLEYINRALKSQCPIHIEFRIQTTKGEKHILYITNWSHSQKGQNILCGTFQEITDLKIKERELYEINDQITGYRQQIIFDELNASIGHWQINLLTRKVVVSDNLYRIYGLKSHLASPGLNSFINYIHHEDQEMVSQAYKKLLSDQLVPNIDFRITRSDGRIRYLSQKAKLLTYRNEPIIAATVQDVTVQKMLEKRLAEVSFREEVLANTQKFEEEIAGLATCTLDLHSGTYSWSEHFYIMLGIKPHSVELNLELLINSIHPDDQKLFRSEWERALGLKNHCSVEFRLIKRGVVHYIKSEIGIQYIHDKPLLVAALQDVSSGQDLKSRLQKQVQMANILSENILDRIIVTDLNNNIVIWNNQCELSYKIQKEAAIGKNFFDVFPLLRSEDQVALFEKVLKGEKLSFSAARSIMENGYFDRSMLPVWNDDQDEVIGIMHIIHDVTKEVLLRQNLNERLNFISNLLDASVDRVIALDSNMNYVYWNKKAEQYYGLKSEDVVGKNILETFPSFINDPSYEQFREALKGKTVHIPAQPGSKKEYFETYLIPTHDESGEVSGVLWMVHDLLKEFELQKRALKENEVLDALNENYVELDDEYRVLFVNHGALKYFNVEKQDLLGRSILELYPGFVNSPIHHALKKAMEEGISTIDEFISPIKNIWLNVSIAPTIDGVVAVFYEIENIKKAQKVIQETNDLLESVFNTSSNGLMLLKTIRDNVGEINDFEYVMVNQMAKNLLDTDVTGKSFKQTYNEKILPNLFDKLENVLVTGIPFTEEYFFFRKGARMWHCIKALKLGDSIVISLEDITERKNNEQELLKHIRILQQSEQLAHMGSWEYELATGSFHWSEGMYQLFELEPSKEVYPEIYLEYVQGKHTSKVEQLINFIKNGKGSFEELIQVTVSGNTKTLKIKGSGINDLSGNTYKVLGVGIDITSLQLAEEKIQESQDILFQTTLAVPDAINIYDVSSRETVHLNNCLAEWTGISREAMVEMGYAGRLKLVHIEDREKLVVFNNDMHHATDNDIRTIEYRLITSRGKTIWIRDRSKVFKRDQYKAPTHILSILQDITQEVELRNQLMERTQYAEVIIDSSVDRIMLYDQQFTIVAWNSRSAELTGVSKKEAIGKNLFELFPKVRKDEQLFKAFNRALEGHYIHLPNNKSTYTDKYYERFFIPLKNEKKQTYAVLNLMHDVSDTFLQKEKLSELNMTLERKNKELEEKNEEITSFAFIASHDLKEPLRKLYTFSDWLLNRELANLSDTGKSYIKKMANSVRRMDMLIEDILVLTKIDADKKALKSIDLNAILERVTGDMKDYISKHAVEIFADPLPIIKGNDNQLYYLFKNLLSNAIKFNKADRNILIKIGSKQVGGDEIEHEKKYPDMRYHCISFEDNGLGFDPRYSKKIFQVFQRLHDPQVYEGTGMGLAICKKIMDNHNGFITADSVINQGSEFCCYFPVS
jgi:PAS domain S-box-containing protein